MKIVRAIAAALCVGPALLSAKVFANDVKDLQQAIILEADTVATSTSDGWERPYEGHSILRLARPKRASLRRRLDYVLVDSLGLDVMAMTEKDVYVHLTPLNRAPFEAAMAVSHLFQDEDSIQVVTPDVQAVLDKEMTKLMEAESKFQSLSSADKFKADTWFANYHTFEDIRAWYKDLTEKYPDLITFIPSIGKTYEGNDIFAIKVTSGKDRFTKPQIWYHSGDHAREWIGPATVQYFIHQLVTGYGADKTSTSILDRVELIVVPLMNVDGYKYTWKGQRLWRKNRKPNKGDFFGSIGVDLNRNWPSHWGEGGSSSLPYSDVYMGPSPASENEVQALMKFFMNANHTRLVAGIDFHAFSQLILRPYAWTMDDSPDEELLKKAGDGMAAVIREQSGKKYISEKTIELYKATGAASDWFYDEDVFKWLPDRRLYAYTIELRPAADETWGNDGFILPPEQIVPTGKEIFEALKFYTDFVLANPIVVA